MKTSLVFSLLGAGALAVGPGPARAQPSAPPDVARLQADVARLDTELREQKQLLIQFMQADQQRYDLLLQIVRGMQGGNAAATPPIPALPPLPSAPTAAPAAPLAPAAPTTATVTGRVKAPGSASEIYVYVDGLRGSVRPRSIEIKQQNKQFVPAVTVVPVGSKVSFPNVDTLLHNVFSRTPGSAFDLGVVKGGDQAKTVTLTQPGHLEVFCNIHSKMRADLLVVPNPHYTKVRPDGSFEIANVPVGSRKLVVWGPGLKTASETVDVRPGASVSFAPAAAANTPHMNKMGQAYGSYDE